MANSTTRKYGWIKDTSDTRDHLLAVTPPKALPPSVDLRKWCPQVYNQGHLGSCTANALAGLVQFDEIKQKQSDKKIPSRLFIYWNERSLINSTDRDSGAMLRDGIKALNKWGFCDESLWPYSDTQGPNARFLQQPPDTVYAAAKKEIITDYSRVPQTLQSIKSCLANGHPIVFGFVVFESFETEQVAKTGIMPMPNPQERQLGGHAVLCVGYNDVNNQFIIRNSWGPEWGQNGYFLMPYSYLTEPTLAADFWTIQFVP